MLVVAAYGVGTDSTAMLIEIVTRGEQLDLVLFADTGAEKPHTYDYLEMFSNWLKSKGYPAVEVVQTVNKHGQRIRLDDICLEQSVLPSIAYGFKSCSEKHKIRPQDKFVNNWAPARKVWSEGGKITKLIGYDATERHRAKDYPSDKYQYRYPLIEWNIGRNECKEIIKSAGLPQPGKSACYMCPSSQPSEIRHLAATYPDLCKKALEIESNAQLTTVKGLGRHFSWRNVLATDDMFDDEFVVPEIPCGCR